MTFDFPHHHFFFFYFASFARRRKWGRTGINYEWIFFPLICVSSWRLLLNNSLYNFNVTINGEFFIIICQSKFLYGFDVMSWWKDLQIYFSMQDHLISKKYKCLASLHVSFNSIIRKHSNNLPLRIINWKLELWQLIFYWSISIWGINLTKFLKLFFFYKNCKEISTLFLMSCWRQMGVKKWKWIISFAFYGFERKEECRKTFDITSCSTTFYCRR